MDHETFQFPAQDCLSVFCEYMEVKAEELGLSNNTLFRDPCGIDNVSTARDMLRCLIRGNECAALRAIWGLHCHTLHVSGAAPREWELISTVLEDSAARLLTDHYEILGGKTGRLTHYNTHNLSVIARIPDSDELLACTVMGADEATDKPRNRYQAAREALDAAVAKYRDRSADTSKAEVCAKSAVVCVVPPLTGSEYHPTLDILYEKSAGEQLRPASMTKMLTAVIVAEQVPDLDEALTVRQDVLDAIQPHGFYVGDLQAGDTLTVRDALHAMMLPSSNAAAFSLAAHVGNLLLNDYS